MNRKFASVMTGVVFLLFTAGIAGAQTFYNQVLLPGNSIPKFVDQLPVAGDISVINATNLTIPGIPAPLYNTTTMTSPYNIHIKEFKANILPANAPTATPYTGSWVWGYLTDTDITTTPRPSYLGPVVVAQKGITATPTYSNELPVVNSAVLPLLPVDQTLDWANPLNQNCQPDALGNYTNAACGPPNLYTGPEIPVAVHIHGGEVPPAFDGGPDAWFTQGNANVGGGFPGGTYTYPNDQQESTIWFHDHALGLTRLNVYAGMAGLYPILDLLPGGTPGPSAPIATMPAFPQHDIPLIIQDRSFDTNGQIFYNLASNPQPNPTVHPFWIPEFIGDVILVNGKTWPNLNVEPRQYRFRLLNGSNARFYDLTLNKGLSFIAIATDGGYLQNAVSTKNVIIGPGERYEVIVDFTALAVGTKVLMSNAARTPFPGGAKPTRGGTDTVMQFTVVTNATQLPNTAIAAGTPLRAAAIEPIINGFVAGTNITRQLTLNEVIGGGGPLELVVNNSKFNLPLATPGCPTTSGTCRETELPAVGDTEIWEIINITADAHPMHTHLVTFQILDRTPFNATRWINQYDAALVARGVLPGQGPPNLYSVKNADGAIGGNPAINPFLILRNRRLPLPYEMGWKDTAIMYPGEVTRIVVRWAPTDITVGGVAVGQNLYPRFNPSALQGTVGYVWHCHIIDHEDNEMMRNYVVGTARQTVCPAGSTVCQ